MGARGRAVVVALLLGVAVAAGSARPALAACHAFTVSVDPASVAEGGTVTVTIERDFSAAPSNVDIETIDGNATGGQDYEPMRQTINFTGNSVSRDVNVTTINDTGFEGEETFLLRLSNPGGCDPVNTNYTLGPDAQVSILDDDVPTTPTPTSPPTTRPRTTTTTAVTASSDSSTTATTLGTSSSLPTSTTDDGAATGQTLRVQDDGGGGGRGVAIVLALVAIAIAGCLGWWAYQRRPGTSP